MTMQRIQRMAMVAALALSATAAVACDDEIPVSPTEPLTKQVPRGSVQAFVIRELAPNGGTTFVVRVAANDVAVGAYQGVVEFDAGGLTLVESKNRVSRGDGDASVINTTEFAEGRIKFAGFSPTRFVEASVGDGMEAFRFTVKGTVGDVEAKMSVVGTEEGKAIEAEKVLSSKVRPRR